MAGQAAEEERLAQEEIDRLAEEAKQVPKCTGVTSALLVQKYKY